MKSPASSEIRVIERKRLIFLYRDSGAGRDCHSGHIHASGVLLSKGRVIPMTGEFNPKDWKPVRLKVEDQTFLAWILGGIMLAEKLVKLTFRKEFNPPLVVKTKGQDIRHLALVWEHFPRWQTPEFRAVCRTILPLEAAADSLRSKWPKASARLVAKHLRSLGLSLS